MLISLDFFRILAGSFSVDMIAFVLYSVLYHYILRYFTDIVKGLEMIVIMVGAKD